MKKGIAKFTAFCLAAGFTFSQGGALALADETGENAVVHNDAAGTSGFAKCSEYLNVRATADQEGELVGLIPSDGIMEILDADENGWYLIRSGNVEGYVASQFVATGSEAEQIAASAGYTTAEVGALSLNVRAEASDSSDIVGAIEEKEKVEVVADQGNWVKVVLDDGTYGYVSHDYVHVSTEYRTGETLAEIQARLDAEAAAAGGRDGTSSNRTESSYSEEIPSENVYPENSSENSWTEDVFSDDSYSYSSSSDDSYSDDASSDNSYSDDVSSDSSHPDDVSSDDFYSEDSSSDNSYSEDSSSDNSYSEDPSSDNSCSEDPSSDNSCAEDPSSDNSYSEDPSSDSSYSEDPSSDNSYSEDPSSGDSTAEDPSSDDSYSEDTSSGSTGQAIADYACQFVGNPYVWGGTSLTNGADCSGFTMAVFANFGISLPHNAASQSGYGASVSADSLQAGDLVFYSDGSGISHVGIYIGSGQIVHAANSNSGIIISSMYYSTPTCYRRLI